MHLKRQSQVFAVVFVMLVVVISLANASVVESEAEGANINRVVRPVIMGQQLAGLYGMPYNPANRPECSHFTMFTILSSFVILSATILVRGTIMGQQLDHGKPYNPANRPECSYFTMFTILSSFVILSATIR